jgi:preprotein translocase subunit YajC
MIPWFQQLCLLAEDAAASPISPLMWMVPALLIFVLFNTFFSSNPQRREQKHLDQLKSTLKKNDPVVTAGGILGTVANVSPEKNEVTIKVDDNTRLRVQMRSVLALPKDEGKESKPETPPAETK